MRIPRLDPARSPLSPAQAEQLNLVFSVLAPEQTAWLLGFFGAASQLRDAPAALPGHGTTRLTVLFASRTGNAAQVARQLATTATAAGLPCAAIDIARFPTARLGAERNLVLVASTQGEGEPPDSAAEFHRFLMGEQAPRLPGLRFAVLALGDESYDRFCQAGADFDRRLAELGAERVLPRVECDVEYAATAASWQQVVIEAFRSVAEPGAVSAPGPEPAAKPSRPDQDHPFAAPVLARRNLNGPGSDKKTVHLELSLAGSGTTYGPGDTLGVLPRNSESYVEELLAALHLAADASVTVDGQDRPLGQVLVERCEVTTVTRSFVAAYATATGHAELAALVEKRNAAAFRTYARGRELVDVACSYPPAGLSAQAFVAMLRRLPPRRYSIASSLPAHPDAAYLLVALTRYESHGRVREGVCSGYLCERLAAHEPLLVYPSPNPSFKLPADGDARIIMIGPGTGVAPFRAFVEERATLGCRGRNWLFFGDRHAATDFLYQDEWQRWYRSGVLSRLDLAFSRDQTEKVYVQHRMREAARDLYAWLEAGAYVYVCGDAARMAPAVHETLLAVIGQEGGKDREAAEEYVAALRAARRYQRDVY